AADGSAFVYSTYLGGIAHDEADDMTVDSAGNAYLTGFTAFFEPNNFPLVRPADDVWGDIEGFVSKIAPGTGYFANYWGQTGSLLLPRFSHTATTLANGKVLVAGGCAVPTAPEDADPCPIQTSSTEIFDPASGSWLPAAPMGFGRSGHTATLLADGRVLIAGGCLPPSDAVDCPGNNSSEIYNPTLGVWLPAGPLSFGRRFHTATLLANGKVLVSGGKSGSTALSASEIFDPSTGLWSAVGSMSQFRFNHTASLLQSGKLLVVGGQSTSAFLSSAELFDPSTGVWNTTGPLPSARAMHTSTLLSSGKVLVAGGSNATSSTKSSILYDPSLGSWSATGSLRLARSTHAATLLPSGKVLVAGGQTSTADAGRPRPSAELYDPATELWGATSTMRQGRSGSPTAPTGHSLSLLLDGRVLVVGGIDGTAAEIFIAQSDLSIVNTQDSPDPVSLGEELAYTAGVINRGLSSASGVTVTEVLPSGARFVSAASSQGTCAQASGTVTCLLGSLSMGKSATITVVIEPNIAGTETNIVSVSSNEQDPHPSDNSASISTTVTNSESCSIIGTGGDDILVGTGDPDVICGLGGNDTISGLAGDDRLLGGSGNDSIDGDGGADIIDGGKGDDAIVGGMGADQLKGGSGSDTMSGNGGDDALDGVDGVSGNDSLDGGAGANTCTADSGDTLASC
ncbi:MAG: kelch repeat-containing protein, partial [Actinomycetota bacterium]